MRIFKLSSLHIAALVLISVLTASLLTYTWVGAVTGEITIDETSILLTDGTNPMVADLNMGDYDIDNVTIIDATNITATNIDSTLIDTTNVSASNIESTQLMGAYSYMIYIDPDNSSIYNAKASNGTICWSSTNHTAVAESVISAVSSTGGIIKWGIGEFPTENLQYSDNIYFEGSGQVDDTGNVGTVLIRTNDVPIFNSSRYPNQSRDNGWKMMTLQGQGNASGSTPLIDLCYTANTIIEQVTFQQSGGAGVLLSDSTYWVTLRNCQGFNLTDALLDTDSSPKTTLIVENCIAHYCGRWLDIYGVKGFIVSSGGVDHITGNVIDCQASVGVIQGVDIEGLIGVPSTGHGILIASCVVHINGCRLLYYGNDYSKYPVYVSGNNYWSTISGNKFEETTGSVDIGLSSANGVTITGNRLSTTATYGIYNYANNPTVFASYNNNWQTVAKGVATNVSNTTWVTLPYTLAGTPNIFQLTCNASTTVYPLAANTTHIQVGVESGTVTVYYYTEYKP